MGRRTATDHPVIDSPRAVTLCGVIPDIAFMIVVYGSARLVISAMDKARHSGGTAGTIANWATVVVAATAVVALVLLGVAVAGSANSVGNLGG